MKLQTIDPHSTYYENVYLPETTGTTYNESLSLAPQHVTTVEPDSGFSLLDSTNLPSKEKNKVNFTFYSEDGNKLISNSSRLRIRAVYGDFLLIPNVNPRNNKIVIEIDLPGGLTQYTITLPESNYLSQSDFIDGLIEGLQTVEQSFNFSPFRNDGTTLINNKYYITIICNHPFRFLDTPENTMLNKGKNLCTLPITDLKKSITIGPIKLQYTRYFDIVSSTLSKYKKKDLTTNNIKSTDRLIFRGILGRLGSSSNIPIILSQSSSGLTDYINFIYTEDLYSIDFKILDENGEELYIPDYEGNGENAKGFNVGMYINQR